MDRLLILSCSQRKSSAQGLLPALDRYDGPAFRVLRKYLREVAPDDLTVQILSAKFGLIEAQREIPCYDYRLTKAHAQTLRAEVLEAARQLLPTRPWQAVGVCAGRDYQSAISGLGELLPPGVSLDLLSGGLGKRLAALRDWLRS